MEAANGADHVKGATHGDPVYTASLVSVALCEDLLAEYNIGFLTWKGNLKRRFNIPCSSPNMVRATIPLFLFYLFLLPCAMNKMIKLLVRYKKMCVLPRSSSRSDQIFR